MSNAISRAQFLRGDFFGGHDLDIRPPWSLPEAEFITRCTTCFDCINACPENIIKQGRGNYPLIDFSQGECTFCGACRSACNSGALSASETAWTIKAHISDECLARKHIVCSSCAEQCEPRAIRFKPVAGDVPQPVLALSRCTGCGACVRPCPTRAIKVHPQEITEE